MIKKNMQFQDYVQTIIRRKWVMISVFIIVVTIVLIHSYKQIPVYEAVATIEIERRSPNVISVQPVAPMGTTESGADYLSYFITQYKIIKSRSVLSKVADYINEKVNIDDEKKYSVADLIKNVNVQPVRNSQLVYIAAEDDDPSMAALIANTVANEYIKQNLEKNIKAANEAAEWLTQKIEEQRQKYMDAELVLQKYRTEHNIEIFPQTSGVSAIEDIKAEYAQAQALLANYNERYTDEHPKVIELKAQIASLRNKIDGLEGFNRENKTMEFRVLEGEVQNNKRMYELLLSRFKEIDLSSTLIVNNIRVVDKAEIPEKPIRPDVKKDMLLAVLLGLIIGITLGFFVDYFDMTIKYPQDITEILECYFLGGIPEMHKLNYIEKNKVVMLQPRSSISETYRQIRTEILSLMPKDGISKSILVTSAEPQAGKTTTSSNLSIALAQMESKVVLIDGDLRKPQLHNIFKADRGYGLTDFLIDNIPLPWIIKDTEIENLKIITSGRIVNNPSEIMGSKRMKNFIQDIKEKFDFVIFDSPPIASVTDAIILANMVDASIQVVRSGKALASLVARAKEKLMNTKAKMLGILLNDFNIYATGYHYDKYYNYYHEDFKKDKMANNTIDISKKHSVMSI